MFWNNYPYTDFHELNLDWILSIIKQMEKTIKDFVALNVIKYATPIEWSIDRQYSGNTVVIDSGSGIAYISSQPVPAGVQIDNVDYWNKIMDLSEVIANVNENLTIHDDLNNSNATFASSIGDWLMWRGSLYKVISDIPVGMAYSVDTNIKKYTVEDYFEEIPAVTPEMFNAAGDGSSDDTIALKLAANTGKNIILNGSYKITESVTIPENVMVSGSGEIIIDASETNDGLVLSSGASVNGITFTDINENNYKSTGHVILAENVTNVHVDNCTFKDIHLGYCIMFYDSSQFSANYNHINGYAYAGISAILSCQHFEFNNNVVLDGRWTGNTNRYPICISGYFDSNKGPARFIECNYNYIEDVTPLWEGIDSHGVCDCQLIGNHVKNVAYGLYFGQPTNAGNISSQNERLIIKNNYIECTCDATGYMYGIGITADQGNTIHNIEIANNTIIGTGTPPSYTDTTAGIWVVRRSGGVTLKNIMIHNNYVDGNNSAIAITGNDTEPLENIIIENNILKGGVYAGREAIRLNNAVASEYKNFVIRNNSIIDHIGYDIVGVSSYSGNELITYTGNVDTGNYVRDSFITTPKSSLPSATSAKGISGQVINSRASDTVSEWKCKTTGSWLAISGTSV